MQNDQSPLTSHDPSQTSQQSLSRTQIESRGTEHEPRQPNAPHEPNIHAPYGPFQGKQLADQDADAPCRGDETNFDEAEEATDDDMVASALGARFDPQTKKNYRPPKLTVGIGASAGGLEALERFFSRIDPDTDVAFVVVQHLSPDFKSVMDELLARYTSLEIHKVEDSMLVEANALYLIPPKKEMVISQGRLLLTDKDPGKNLSLPIDVFLKSLAKDAGERSLAVILSGTGSDGSRGVRSIHEAGGLVLVQNEGSAKFDGMPRAAIDTGCADFVLKPEEMPQVIVRHVTQLDGLALSANELVDSQSGPLQTVFRQLRQRYGIDFSHYKPTTVTRRIQRRLTMTEEIDIESYAQRVASDPKELSALYHDLLVGVTRFFRDPEAFAVLEEKIVPELIQKSLPDEAIRVWVAGCATGEEAYSLAMLLHEQLEARGDRSPVKIFATDVHRESLDFASTGIYRAERIANVSDERRARFFEKQGEDHYQVSKELRQLLVFAPHNVIRDAPFTKIDLVTCRNLLIYLESAAQKKVITLFRFALRMEGILMLGPSEGLGALADDFETIDERWKVYRKNRDRRIPVQQRFAVTPDLRTAQPAAPATPGVDQKLLRTYDQLLSEHMPPSILVNARRELLHTFGDARKYLHPPEGRPTSDIAEMVEDNLKIAIATAVQKSIREANAVVYKGIRIHDDDADERTLQIEVRPLKHREYDDRQFLVQIIDTGPPEGNVEQPEEFDVGVVSRQRIGALELELQYTKESLQTTIEELETSNEELQATNQELVASNEELQSTNEELHSVNEELYTVNSEYQRKIVELTEVTSDMDNLLRSNKIGTIFLDKTLAIRKSTPMAGDSFGLLPQDVGRPIDHLTYNIDHEDLISDAEAVLRSGEGVEREIRNRGGEPFLLRIVPYHAASKAIDGIVLTFVDTASIKRAEQERAAATGRYQSLVHALQDVVYEHSFDDDLVKWSEAYESVLGYSSGEIGNTGESRRQRIHPADLPSVDAEFERGRKGDQQFDLTYRFLHRQGHYIWVHERGQMLSDEEGQVVAQIGIMKNITREKQTEAELIETKRFLEDVMQAVPTPLLVLDTEQRVTIANLAFQQVFNASAAVTLGRRIYELGGELWESDGIRRLLEEEVHRGESVCSADVECQANTPDAKVYQLRAKRLERLGSRPHLVLLTVDDMTERQPTDDRLKNAMLELRRSNERLEQFAYVASHDLQEPLRMMASFCKLLEKKYKNRLDEHANRYIGHVVDGADRMKGLIDGLLAFSRITRTGASFEPCESQEALDAAVQNVADAIAKAQAQITHDELPQVLADKTQITQLFQNLVSNAIKFRGSDPPKIHIGCKRSRGHWQFSVRDNGIGIDPQYHEKIFEIFQRLHPRDEYPGTGIGLSLCRRIVERRGGRIWVESTPGNGTTFHFTIPGDG